MDYTAEKKMKIMQTISKFAFAMAALSAKKNQANANGNSDTEDTFSILSFDKMPQDAENTADTDFYSGISEAISFASHRSYNIKKYGIL